MIIADLKKIKGNVYPARRKTQNITGGVSPIQTKNFCMGYVTLEPHGGQVPWHNQEQEEVYFLLKGKAEMCLGKEKTILEEGQAVFIPSGEFHQITNISDTQAVMIYCYGPAGEVAHWKQELEGTLPKAGIDVPPLPEGAYPQCTKVDAS